MIIISLNLPMGNPRAKSFDCVEKIARMAGLPMSTGRVKIIVITNTPTNTSDLAIKIPAINLQLI